MSSHNFLPFMMSKNIDDSDEITIIKNVSSRSRQKKHTKKKVIKQIIEIESSGEDNTKEYDDKEISNNVVDKEISNNVVVKEISNNLVDKNISNNVVDDVTTGNYKSSSESPLVKRIKPNTSPLRKIDQVSSYPSTVQPINYSLDKEFDISYTIGEFIEKIVTEERLSENIINEEKLSENILTKKDYLLTKINLVPDRINLVDDRINLVDDERLFDSIVTDKLFENNTKQLSSVTNPDMSNSIGKDTSTSNIINENDCLVILRGSEGETKYYLKEDSLLEELFEMSGVSKVKYRGIPVSKYLSLNEIGYSKDFLYFDIIDDGSSDLNLKINVDFYSTNVVKINKYKKVCDILKMCNKEGIIVMNGIIINTEMKIKDVFENDDVVDVV